MSLLRSLGMYVCVCVCGGGGGGGGGGEGKGPGPPWEKHKLYGIQLGISNWNPPRKNVGAPLEPRKIIIFFEINHWH